MFGTIRKHQSWLWFIIIGVTILGMVMWQSQTGNNSNTPRTTGNFGSIDNVPITATEMEAARTEAALFCLARTGAWPERAGSQFDVEKVAIERLFLTRRLTANNIHSDPDSAAKLAGMILQRLGNGQPFPMDKFVEEDLKPRSITAEDFQRFLEHEISIQQLMAMVGLSGKLVTPAEIQGLYLQEYQELSVAAVFFSASNYLGKIQAPDAVALGQFYTNQMAAYREPEQMQLRYVFFNVTNFMAQGERDLGTNLVRTTDEAIAQLGTNTALLGKTPVEVRAKVREILIQGAAMTNATKAAIAFQNEMVAKTPDTVENLNAVAKEKGLTVMVTSPFEKSFSPLELNLGSAYPVETLFNLTAKEPFAPSPIPGTDGVYILALNKFIPSQIPPLDQIRTRVEHDYKMSQAMRLAQIDGAAFAQTATNETAHGKTFAQTCAATRVTPVLIPPFSLSSPRMAEVEDHATVSNFKEVAYGTPVGASSAFIQTPEGGFVVHVRERLPIDQAQMKAKLVEFGDLVRQRRQSEAFEVWFDGEAATSLRDIPSLNRQAQIPQ